MSRDDRTLDESSVVKSQDHDDLGEGVVEESLETRPVKRPETQATLKRFWHVPNHDDTVHDGAKLSEPAKPIANRKRGLNQIVEHMADTKSSTPKKKQRQSSKYAPPEMYAHLSKLVDILEPNLIGVFVGFNPGVRTATAGHAYAHPSNMFWKLVHSSGITDVRLRPEQDVDLPRLYSMGNTNLVDRPSKDTSQLSKQEMAAGTPILEEKIRTFRPEAVCIVGKSIWQSMWRWKYKREMKKEDFKYGWQDAKQRMGKEGDWPGAWVFVATATSGLAASLSKQEKEAIWKPFGEWVQKRREERRVETAAVKPVAD